MLSKTLIVILLICSISACAETEKSAKPWSFESETHEVEYLSEAPDRPLDIVESVEVPYEIESLRKSTDNVYLINDRILWRMDLGAEISDDATHRVVLDENRDVLVYHEYVDANPRAYEQFLYTEDGTERLGELDGRLSVWSSRNAAVVVDASDNSVLIRSTADGVVVERGHFGKFVGDWIVSWDDTNHYLRHVWTGEMFAMGFLGNFIIDGRFIDTSERPWRVADPELQEIVLHDPGPLHNFPPGGEFWELRAPVRLADDAVAFRTDGGLATVWRNPEESIAFDCQFPFEAGPDFGQRFAPSFKIPQDRSYFVVACGSLGVQPGLGEQRVRVIDLDKMQLVESFDFAASLLRGYTTWGDIPWDAGPDDVPHLNPSTPVLTGVRRADQIPFYWSPQTGFVELSGTIETYERLGPGYIRGSENGDRLIYCEQLEDETKLIQRDLRRGTHTELPLENGCAFRASDDLSEGLAISESKIFTWSVSGTAWLDVETNSDLSLGRRYGDLATVTDDERLFLYDMSDRVVLELGRRELEPRESVDSPRREGIYTRGEEQPVAWIHRGFLDGREINIFGWREAGLSSATNLGPGDWRVFETKGEVWLVQNKDGEAELKKVAL